MHSGEKELQYSDNFILALDFSKIIWYSTFNFRSGNFELQNAVTARDQHSYVATRAVLCHFQKCNIPAKGELLKNS